MNTKEIAVKTLFRFWYAAIWKAYYRPLRLEAEDDVITLWESDVIEGDGSHVVSNDISKYTKVAKIIEGMKKKAKDASHALFKLQPCRKYYILEIL